MSDFKIANEKRFPLVVTNSTDNVDLLDYYRWEHRVTISYGFKKFMVFLDNLTSSLYIEEITTGNLETINDDSLWSSLFKWATDKGFINILPPLPKPPGYTKSKLRLMEKKISI